MIKDLDYTVLELIFEPMEWLYDGDDQVILED